jgi:hypothetical protein
MNGPTKRKVIGYIAAIFLSGVLAGGVAGYTLAKQRPSPMPKPQEMAQGILSHLKTRLQLTSEQMTKARPLVEQTCSEIQAKSREQRKEISQRFEAMDMEITAFLSQMQREEFEKMQQERRELMSKHGRSRPADGFFGRSGSNCPTPGRLGGNESIR